MLGRMGYKVGSARVRIEMAGGSVTAASVKYAVEDEADTTLQRRGTIALTLPQSMKLQIAELIEDELRRGGHL